MNTFGTFLRLTTFGESHGPAMGGVLDGMPPRIMIRREVIASAMAERRPGQPATSARRETDEVEILSGISAEGLTFGTPIGFIIRNRDARPEDYDRLADVFRPNHADYTYEARYGIRDHRGGGRASARETASRVAAGAIAGEWLSTMGISVRATLAGVGRVTLNDGEEAMLAEARRAREDGDSVGGLVVGTISGLQPGVGSPVFGKLQARLAAAMMGIPAAKGFEYGLGFAAARLGGAATADIFRPLESAPESLPPRLRMRSNYSGGIQGGISNGEDIYFRVAFKPTPTIGREIKTVNRAGEAVTLQPGGRHDPCVAIRAVTVVKAMTILTVADMLLDPQLRFSPMEPLHSPTYPG